MRGSVAYNQRRIIRFRIFGIILPSILVITVLIIDVSIKAISYPFKVKALNENRARFQNAINFQSKHTLALDSSDQLSTLELISAYAAHSIQVISVGNVNQSKIILLEGNLRLLVQCVSDIEEHGIQITGLRLGYPVRKEGERLQLSLMIPLESIQESK